MESNTIIIILIIAPYILAFGLKAYEKIRPIFRRYQKEKIKKYAELERVEMFHRLLASQVYPLGYEENIYLREDVTSIYSFYANNKKFFRAGDDGSISSKVLSRDELKSLTEIASIVQEFISCWQNGYVVKSSSLKEHRTIAVSGTLMLTARYCLYGWSDFTIWEYKDKQFTNGKCIGDNYVEAKEMFAYFLLASHAQFDKNSDDIIVKKRSFEANPVTHEITAIIPVDKNLEYPFV